MIIKHLKFKNLELRPLKFKKMSRNNIITQNYLIINLYLALKMKIINLS
jgi:hypothetical protein